MSNLAEVSLFAGGIFNLGFTVFHLFFWKLFDWKKDLASLTPVNRSVSYTQALAWLLGIKKQAPND
jgi:hypothetical protein